MNDVRIKITASKSATTLSVDGSKSNNDTIKSTAEIAMRIKRSVFPMFFFIDQMYVCYWL